MVIRTSPPSKASRQRITTTVSQEKNIANCMVFTTCRSFWNVTQIHVIRVLVTLFSLGNVRQLINDFAVSRSRNIRFGIDVTPKTSQKQTNRYKNQTSYQNSLHGIHQKIRGKIWDEFTSENRTNADHTKYYLLVEYTNIKKMQEVSQPKFFREFTWSCVSGHQPLVYQRPAFFTSFTTFLRMITAVDNDHYDFHGIFHEFYRIMTRKIGTFSAFIITSSSGYTKSSSGYTKSSSGYTKSSSGYTKSHSGYTKSHSGYTKSLDDFPRNSPDFRIIFSAATGCFADTD